MMMMTLFPKHWESSVNSQMTTEIEPQEAFGSASIARQAGTIYVVLSIPFLTRAQNTYPAPSLTTLRGPSTSATSGTKPTSVSPQS